MIPSPLRVAALSSTLLLAASAARPTDVELHPLGSLDELRQAFDRDAGVPRLVLLLSPT